MDVRRDNIIREIQRLEAALEQERRTLACAPEHHRRQLLRRNLAASYEALGALYRRLHALDAAAPPADPQGDDLLLYLEIPAQHQGVGR
jgi:hypothetical protein